MADTPASLDPTGPSTATQRRRRRRWPRRVVLAGGGLLILAWVGLVGLKLDHAAHLLQTGVTAANRVRNEVTTQDLADNQAASDLAAAHADFAAAHADVHNVWTAPLHVLPWVGRQVSS